MVFVGTGYSTLTKLTESTTSTMVISVVDFSPCLKYGVEDWPVTGTIPSRGVSYIVMVQLIWLPFKGDQWSPSKSVNSWCIDTCHNGTSENQKLQTILVGIIRLVTQKSSLRLITDWNCQDGSRMDCMLPLCRVPLRCLWGWPLTFLVSFCRLSPGSLKTLEEPVYEFIER